MDPILDIAKRHNLKVIEDCAQAIGAAYKGRKSGSIGHIGTLSFFPSKNLGGAGDGGMIVTNDEGTRDKIRLLRVHGSRKGYLHDVIGYNSRLDNLQAAVLRVKLKHLDKWITARRKHALKYDQSLSGLKNLTLPFSADYSTHTYHQYIVKTGNRADFKEFLLKNGVESRVYYPIPLHLQNCYKFLGYSKKAFPNSEEAAESVVALPVHSELRSEQQERVVDTIKEFLKK